MTKRLVLFWVACLVCSAALAAARSWPAPVASAVPEADGYVAIPDAAVPAMKSRTYKAIFDATQGSADPGKILPALNMLGSELNLFRASGIPAKNVHFAVAFHGDAVDGLLRDDAYRAKFGVPNPNLPVLARLKGLGVDLLVCGQFLAAESRDPASLSPDVTVASDALLVLIAYQNQGYALLSF